jgi:Fur family peroxide stress response transcriptional regulator
MNSRHDINDRLADFERACLRAQVKVTHQRLEVFREVIGSDDHPNAEAILERLKVRLPTVSLDTVYRTLWLLTDLGLIGTLEPRQKSVRFDANLEPHHHFICLRCGRVFDVDIAGNSETVDGRKDSFLTYGSIESVRLEARGVCNSCQKQDQARETSGK